MLSIWRYVVVGAVVAAAVLTPSTDPLTQLIMAGPPFGSLIRSNTKNVLQLPKRKIGFSILYDLGFCLI